MTNRDVVEQFETAVASFPEVTEVRRVDYLIRAIVAAGNVCERFQTEKMYPLPSLNRIVSTPTMKTITPGGL